MRIREARPQHHAVAELRAHAGERAVRQRQVAARPLGEQRRLPQRGPHGAGGEPYPGDAGLQRQRLQAQPHQVQQLADIQSRRGGTDPLGARGGAIEPQVQGQTGQRLVARGGGGQQPIQQALDGEQQPGGVGLGMLQVEARNQRLRDPQRLHRRLQDTGGALVQAMRRPAEAAADALRRQRQEGAHRPHTKLVQTVMERRVDTQPASGACPARIRSAARSRTTATGPPAAAVRAMAYVPKRVKPQAMAAWKPAVRSAVSIAPAHWRSDVWRCDRPEASSQKTPGSSPHGSTPGVNRRSCSTATATDRSTSAGATSPARSAGASTTPAP